VGLAPFETLDKGFVFDEHKQGYFETDELKLLINILHRVEKDDIVKVEARAPERKLRRLTSA
jgi:hypothetical protein